MVLVKSEGFDSTGSRIVVRAGMNHYCSESKGPWRALVDLFIYFKTFFATFITNMKQKKKVYNVAGKTLWISQQQPSDYFAIFLKYVSGEEMGNDGYIILLSMHYRPGLWAFLFACRKVWLKTGWNVFYKHRILWTSIAEAASSKAVWQEGIRNQKSNQIFSEAYILQLICIVL